MKDVTDLSDQFDSKQARTYLGSFRVSGKIIVPKQKKEFDDADQEKLGNVRISSSALENPLHTGQVPLLEQGGKSAVQVDGVARLRTSCATATGLPPIIRGTSVKNSYFSYLVKILKANMAVRTPLMRQELMLRLWVCLLQGWIKIDSPRTCNF